MGIIQKQSIRSTLIIMTGFALGAFNIMVLQQRVLTPAQFGLTRMITDAGLTLATMCTFGALPIIYKFYPFYKSYLPTRKNDLPFVTLLVCLAGFIVMSLCGYALKDIIVRKYSERSPLFVQYSYLVYPYALCLLLFTWLESFGWSFKKGVVSNSLRETLPRVLFTLLLVLAICGFIRIPLFFWLFSLSFLLPAVLMFWSLRQTGEFRFTTTISPVTRRLKGRMFNFGLFLFGAQFLNLLSRTIDTFIVSAKSERGLTDTAVLTVATYAVAFMEVPQRSMNSITVPTLAEAWQQKNMNSIRNIYVKSVTNLLLVGLAMLSLLWLNVHNLGLFMGKDYAGIEMVVLLMGLGKLIDLGTGANAQVIATSSYWRVDFMTNVVYTVLALPLNYILIARYGLMGAAYSSLISLSFYNLMRFAFLWYRFGLQPYQWKDLLAILYALAAVLVTYFIPRLSSVVLDTAMRSALFCLLFIPAVYVTRISAEVNQLILKYAQLLKALRRQGNR